MDLCFGSGTTKINKFDVEMPFSDNDVPIVNIFDFTAQDVRNQWQKIPAHFKIGESPPPLRLDQQRKVVIRKDGRTVTLEARRGRPPRVVHATECFDLEA